MASRFVLRGNPIGRLCGLQGAKGFLRGFFQIRIFPPLGQERSEHQAKQTALLQSEIDIGEPQFKQRVWSLHRRYHCGGKLPEPFGRDRGEKIFLTGEVPIRRGRGHPDEARHLAQSYLVGAILFEDGSGGGPQGVGHIAVPIGFFDWLFHDLTFRGENDCKLSQQPDLGTNMRRTYSVR